MHADKIGVLPENLHALRGDLGHVARIKSTAIDFRAKIMQIPQELFLCGRKGILIQKTKLVLVAKPGGTGNRKFRLQRPRHHEKRPVLIKGQFDGIVKGKIPFQQRQVTDMRQVYLPV